MNLKRISMREMVLLLKKPTVVVSPHCRIRAQNDVEAIERWLDEYFDKPTTFRTYKKEAERFLVWCAKARTTNFSCLDREDVDAYIEFLKNPSPKEVWCGPRRKKAAEDIWYPFTGPLSASAIKTALAVLNSLMSYLVDARYIEINPFALIRRKSRFKQQFDEQSIKVYERILLDEEWRALLSTLEAEPELSEREKWQKHRLKFMVSSLFFLGLRIDELASGTWQDCKKLNGKWWFFVRGKGDRLGKIPINAEFLHSIMQYRHGLKMDPLPKEGEMTPLIHSLGSKDKGLTVRQMSNLLKDLSKKAANLFELGSSSHQKLLRFSPHWLRHLSASKQDLAGISFTNIKSNLRSSSWACT